MFVPWTALASSLLVLGASAAPPRGSEHPPEHDGNSTFAVCRNHHRPSTDPGSQAHKRAVLDRRDFVGHEDFPNRVGFMDALMDKAKKTNTYASRRNYNWQIFKVFEEEQRDFVVAGEQMDGNVVIVVWSKRAIIQQWIPGPTKGGLNQLELNLKKFDPQREWIGETIARNPQMFAPETRPKAFMLIPKAPRAEQPVDTGNLWYLVHGKFDQMRVPLHRVWSYAPTPYAHKLYGFKTAAAMCNLFDETLNSGRIAFQYDPGEGALPPRIGQYFQDRTVAEGQVSEDLPAYEGPSGAPPPYPLPPAYRNIYPPMGSGSGSNAGVSGSSQSGRSRRPGRSGGRRHRSRSA